MKKLESVLLKACGYTVLIMAVFYAFMSLNDESSLSLPTFVLISVFGILVSVTTMILGLKKPALPIRILLHYASLLLVFYVVFIAIGKRAASTPAQIFSAVIIFTVVYIFMFIAVYFIRLLIGKIDKRLDKKSARKHSSKQDTKSEYKPIYK